MGKPQLIRHVFDSMKGRKIGKSITAMFAIPFWPQIVGSQIAIHCHPVEFTNNELVVECDSSSWCSVLNENQTMILGRIAETVGHSVIRKLRPVIRKQKQQKMTASEYKEPPIEISEKKFAWIESVVQEAPADVRESLMGAMLATIQNKMRKATRRNP